MHTLHFNDVFTRISDSIRLPFRANRVTSFLTNMYSITLYSISKLRGEMSPLITDLVFLKFISVFLLTDSPPFTLQT
jgi:hypothetical protein